MTDQSSINDEFAPAKVIGEVDSFSPAGPTNPEFEQVQFESVAQDSAKKAKLEHIPSHDTKAQYKQEQSKFKKDGDLSLLDYKPIDPTQPLGTSKNPGKVQNVSGFTNNLLNVKVSARTGMMANLMDYAFRDESQFRKKKNLEIRKFWQLHTDPIIDELKKLEKGDIENPINRHRKKELEQQLETLYDMQRAELAGELDPEEGMEFDVETFKMLGEAISNDFGAFGAELVNEISANPQFFITPAGWRMAARNILAKTGSKIAAQTAGATSAAALGASLEVGIEASNQLKETGQIDNINQLSGNAKLGAIFGVLFGFPGGIGLNKSIRTIDPELADVIEADGDIMAHLEKNMEPRSTGDEQIDLDLKQFRLNIGYADEPLIDPPHPDAIEVLNNIRRIPSERGFVSDDVMKKAKAARSDTGLLREKNGVPVQELPVNVGREKIKEFKDYEDALYMDTPEARELAKEFKDQEALHDISSEEFISQTERELADVEERIFDLQNQQIAARDPSENPELEKLRRHARFLENRLGREKEILSDLNQKEIAEELAEEKRIFVKKEFQRKAIEEKNPGIADAANNFGFGKFDPDEFNEYQQLIQDIEVQKDIIKDLEKDIEQTSVPSNQKGSATTDAMTALAAIGGASYLGYGIAGEEGVATTLGIAAGGLGGAKILGNVLKNVRRNYSVEDVENLDRMLDNHLSDASDDNLKAFRASEMLKRYLPDAADRKLLTFAMENEQWAIDKLSPDGKRAMHLLRKEYDHIQREANRLGLVDNYIQNYVPHVWEERSFSAQRKLIDLFKKSSAAGKGTFNVSQGKHRIFSSIRKGMDAGFTPRTLDAAELFGMYSGAMNRAMRVQELTTALSKESHVDGRKYLHRDVPNEEVDDLLAKGYVKHNNEFMPDMYIHPDMVDSMNLVFGARSDNALIRGISAINMITKRLLVGSSFFHAKALGENAMFANGLWNMNRLAEGDVSAGNIPPEILNNGKLLPGIKSDAQAFMGWFDRNKMFKDSHPALELLRHGEAGDMVERALRSGVKIGIVEDLGPDDFFGVLEKIKRGSEMILPTSMKGSNLNPVGWPIKFQKAIDEIMWDRVMTGGKLMTWGMQVERMMQKNLKQHNKNPDKYPLIPINEIEKKAAAFVNDAFGNQNWEANVLRLQDGMRKRILKKVSSPKGRQLTQLFLFAPDWTISNIKAITKGIPGVNNDPLSREMYQRYTANALGMLFVIANAVEQGMGGDGTLNNEDWLTIEYPDAFGGTSKFTASKQVSEVFGWVARPSQGRKPIPSAAQTLIQKGGTYSKIPFEYLLNKQWLSLPDQRFGRNRDQNVFKRMREDKFPPAIWDEDNDTTAEKFTKGFLHALNKNVPITIKQYQEKGPLAMTTGFLGVPHKPSKQKRAAIKRERAEKKRFEELTKGK